MNNIINKVTIAMVTGGLIGGSIVFVACLVHIIIDNKESRNNF